MTSIFRLKFNLPRLRKLVLWLHGPRNVTWCLGWIFQNCFSEICLVISLWNPLLGSFCLIRKDLCILYGGSFSLSTLLAWVAFAIFSPPLKNFHVVFPTKKCLLCFLSLALDLYCPFSRWALLACCLLSLFLCLCLSLCSKFLDMAINLSLIL